MCMSNLWKDTQESNSLALCGRVISRGEGRFYVPFFKLNFKLRFINIFFKINNFENYCEGKLLSLRNVYSIKTDEPLLNVNYVPGTINVPEGMCCTISSFPWSPESLEKNLMDQSH